MSQIKKKLIALLREDEGLTTVEYAIAGGLVGVTVIGAFLALGTEVGNVINKIKDCISGAGCN